MTCCNILIIVLHHVWKEGHVVGHTQTPMHSNGLTGKEAVSRAASHPYQYQTHTQWSWHQHCNKCVGDRECICACVLYKLAQIPFWLSLGISWTKC